MAGIHRGTILLLLLVMGTLAPSAAIGQIQPGTDPTIPEEGDPVLQPPCSPASWAYTNASGASQVITYTCGADGAGSIQVPDGFTLRFKTPSCGQTENHEICIECGVIGVWLGTASLFSCEPVSAYAAAYGLDLAAEGFTWTRDFDKAMFDSNGDPIKVKQWAIPIVGAEGQLIGWEFTTIEPHFSVESGEVVIRDNMGRVIGGREGITIDD